MKRVLFIWLIIAAVQLRAQIEEHAIRFVDYTPEWIHIVVDSSYIGVPGYNGVHHIYSSIYQTIITDDAIYKTYINHKERWQGGLVEKVDLATGKTLWSTPFDLRTSDERELPQEQYLDEEGNVVVLGFRATQPPIFHIWSEGTFMRRTYDGTTGALIDHRYGDKRDSTAARISWVPVWPAVRIFPVYTNNFLYIFNDGSVKFDYVLMEEDGTTIRDTTYRAPEAIYSRASSVNIIRIDPDTFLVLFHNIKFDSGRFIKDSFLLQAHYYDAGWNRVRTVDLKDKVAPALKFLLHSKDGDIYNVLRVDGDSPTDNSNLLFDSQWNLIGEIPWISSFNTSRTRFTRLKTEQAYLFVVTTKNPSRMMFYKADFQGNITHLRTLEMLTPIVRLESVHALDDGDIILVCRVFYKTSKDSENPEYRQINLLRIDGRDIGLTTTTSDKPSMKTAAYQILENPIQQREIRLSFHVPFSGQVILSDVRGKKVCTYFLDGVKEATLNVESLTGGIYFIRPLAESTQYETMKIVIPPR